MHNTDHETGRQLFLAGNYGEAARRFAAALVRDESADLWNDWASAHAAAGHFLEAFEGFRRAHSLEPANADVLANVEALTQVIGRRAAAMANGRTPEYEETMRNEALSLFRSQQPQAAANVVRDLLLARESARLWNDLGTIYVAMNGLLEAEIAYRRALELDPGNQNAITNFVVLMESTGRAEQAAAWKEKIAPEALANGLYWATRHAVATLINELAKTISTIPPYSPEMSPEMAKALSPMRADSSYFTGRCCELLQAIPDNCKKEIFAAIETLAQQDCRLYLALAEYFLNRDDYEAALPLIQAAFDANPADLHADRLLDRCVQRAKGNEYGTEEYLQTRFCPNPWQHFEIQTSRDIYLCCPSWLPVSIGKIGAGSAEEIWNSAAAQEVRASILDGSFRYCSRNHCPHISGRTLPANDQIGIPGNEEVVKPEIRASRTPSTVALAYDKTCNLACPQCRSNFIFAGPSERQQMDAYIPTILELSQHAQTLFLNGAGEVFGSRHTRQLLQQITRRDFPRLQFTIISNGQLFDRRAYETFDLRGRIQEIQISIDAATADTYAVVRRGGIFERLLTNLGFLDGLRMHEAEQFRLQLNFVVSGQNYREMPAFVTLAKSFHADIIRFTRFRNWGNMTPEQFHAMNITDPAHPEHEQFLKILEDPRLQDPIVDLGSVGQFRTPQPSALLA